MSEKEVIDKDDLFLALREELESVLTKELDDSAYREKHKANVTSQLERTQMRVKGVLMESVRIQRLYFVIRSVIMSLLSALIYFLVVWYLGTIDAVQAAFLGVFVFVASLVTSRLFDKQIVKISKRIISLIGRHKRLKTFILKRL
jgi:hypothetical protein